MEPMLGQIQLFSFGIIPQGWCLCDGTLLQISSNPGLYNLIGTKFGGDDETTFGVPNLMGAKPLNVDANYMCYYIATQGETPQHN